MTEPRRRGEVMSFYSYKGGVGRSMALANVACLLAQREPWGQGVLVIDWDLEAPGLHRFFRPYLKQQLPPSTDGDDPPDQQQGLIDLFVQLDGATKRREQAATDEQATALIHEVKLEQYIIETDISSLHLMKAGRFDGEYPARVNMFKWEDFYKRSPSLIRCFAELLSERYQYVLIDSRTGHTDISGICTMLMPEKLVVVFTPNLQSVRGAIDHVRRAANYRRLSDDLRPLLVFPLPSRIEASEPARRDDWRFGNKDKEIVGYQPEFEELFREIYGLTTCSLSLYFNEVQIQHAPPYAYGEEIAVRVERGTDRLSLAKTFETLASWLVDHPIPWENPADAAKRARLQTRGEDLARMAEKAFSSLTEEQRAVAKGMFLRMVRLDDKGGPESSVPRTKDELGPAAQPVVEAFRQHEVLVVRQDTDSGKEIVEFADAALVTSWARLRGWVAEDREFALWRQELNGNLGQWERAKRDSGALLSGAPLKTAQGWVARRGEDLSEAERSYVGRSGKTVRWRRAVNAIGLAAIVVGGSITWWQNRLEKRREQAAILVLRADSLAIRQSDSAKALYREAIALDRNQAPAYFGLGRLYAQAASFDVAVLWYTFGLQRDTTNARAWYERGAAYFQQDSLRPAIADYSRAILLNNRDADAYFSRGVAYEAARDTAAAVADLGRALQMTGDSALQQAAAQRLRRLGTRVSPPPTGPQVQYRVYIQYADRQDSSNVRALETALRQRGITVEGSELRSEPTSGDVRYFFDNDSVFAASVRSAVELTLAKSGLRQRLRLLRLPPSTGSGATRGQVEVWLPRHSQMSS